MGLIIIHCKSENGKKKVIVHLNKQGFESEELVWMHSNRMWKKFIRFLIWYVILLSLLSLTKWQACEGADRFGKWRKGIVLWCTDMWMSSFIPLGVNVANQLENQVMLLWFAALFCNLHHAACAKHSWKLYTWTDLGMRCQVGLLCLQEVTESCKCACL